MFQALCNAPLRGRGFPVHLRMTQVAGQSSCILGIAARFLYDGLQKVFTLEELFHLLECGPCRLRSLVRAAIANLFHLSDNQVKLFVFSVEVRRNPHTCPGPVIDDELATN